MFLRWLKPPLKSRRERRFIECADDSRGTRVEAGRAGPSPRTGVAHVRGSHLTHPDAFPKCRKPCTRRLNADVILVTAVSEIGVRARLCAKKFKNAEIHEVHTNPQASLPDTYILYVGPLLATSDRLLGAFAS